MIRSLRVSQLPGALHGGADARGRVRPSAQSAAPRDAAGSDLLRQRDQELEAARAEQKRAIETEKKLRAEIDALGEDRRKFNQALIDGAAKVKEIEKRLTANEARIKPLQDQERSLRASLDERQAVIAEVLAALQRIGRRPPPAVMVEPGRRAAIGAHRDLARRRAAGDARARRGSLAADLSELVRHPQRDRRRENALDHGSQRRWRKNASA